jgi:hypothetical protein
VLRLPQEAIEAITGDVRAYGTQRVETGGFLLSPIGDAGQVSSLALAGTVGITRRRGLFAVSGIALDRLFTWADDKRLRIPAQFHSHRGRAFLSPTDLAHGLSVRGFVTCIVPFWNNPPNDPAQWGWWQFDGKNWRDETSPRTDPHRKLAVVTFDERGVR